MEEAQGRLGKEMGVGDWMLIDQDRVDGFADITDDHQWIHQTGDRAEAGPFGGPIAHGFLTLSLLTPLTRSVPPLIEGARMVINYGLDRVRFITPVPVGSRVRGRVTPIEATEVDGGVQVKNQVTIEIEGVERPAAVVESLIRFYR